MVVITSKQIVKESLTRSRVLYIPVAVSHKFGSIITHRNQS